MSSAANPILPGFHPDPSICRVREDYYLVTSTFAYFPGIPVFHSRDLGRWTQIGNVLDRPSQLPVSGDPVSRGIFAPTIRHHRGVFYVITTNIDHGGNFYVTATDPAGPWSEPVWLTDAPGIDPSLFFDDDGRAWYCGTRPRPEGTRYFGDWEVWIQELDLTSGRLLGSPQSIWSGALKESVWPEGPHLYRRNGWYYLLSAEGGTERNHAETAARSRTLQGPWEGNPANPILTHRDLGETSPIVNVGHGDLVEDPDGGWWMVVLGSRPHQGGYCNLGRETFLVPVAWENDWPVVNPGRARVESQVEIPGLRGDAAPSTVDLETFDGPVLGFDWLCLRTPARPFWDLSTKPGRLLMPCRSPLPGERAAGSLLGKRQRHSCFAWTVSLDFRPTALGETAGLLLFQNDDFHYRLERTLEGERPVVRLIAREAGAETILASRPTSSDPLVLSVRAIHQDLMFGWLEGETFHRLAGGVDGRLLSTERAGGFVGTILGLFATGTGRDSPVTASFGNWSYRGEPDE